MVYSIIRQEPVSLLDVVPFRRGTVSGKKTRTERVGDPVFHILVEVLGFGHVKVHM